MTELLGGDALPKGSNVLSPKLKLEELFVAWLSVHGAAADIGNLIADVERGVPIAKSQYGQYKPVSSLSYGKPSPPRSPLGSPAGSPTFNEAFPVHKLEDPLSKMSPPKGSPRGRPREGSPTGLTPGPSASPAATSGATAVAGDRRRSIGSSVSMPGSQSSLTDAAASSASALPIPQFFFPPNRLLEPAERAEKQALVARIFSRLKGQITASQFTDITTQVLGFPSYLSPVVFRRIDTAHQSYITQAQFENFWKGDLLRESLAARLFAFLRDNQPRNYLVPDDFRPMLNELLESHPGLAFLKTSPEFQVKYVDTVIVRIFYSVNRKDDGKISLREFEHSDLVPTMMYLDTQEDINKVLRYFSYEHFYVLYCKFWELDTDHDQYLDKEDLSRYGSHALTSRVIDRIFAEVPRKFTCRTPERMNFEDFIWFLLSEEDKTSDTAIEYWFRVLDLDADGIITQFEMDHFYSEQVQRMESIQMELVAFDDVFCQMIDMIKPVNAKAITLKDVKGCKMAPNFFNVLFNLNKFIAFEQKDPFSMRGEPEDSDWDRFARAEYDRLSAEEEGNEGFEEEEVDQWPYAGASEAPF